ncbi:endonuclease/exonuclease/phosphatase family protein [Ruminococcus sp.]|uniref:endonuclease/exonuclease/phosphatase family protein n=1 Tax=Ruminococcus sp. TaxID=41978 RepID=UPI0025DD9670|nr:endonuclease/exonuclease/phosphatase family protein [Ruminococcus sp.]MBQ8966659.1 endonuclease/exonuclease/phosphatase family protein [Ruminococcus sp.]
MRIATYNIWDSDMGMPARFTHLTAEITGIKADIMCLQEVSDPAKHQSFSALCGYGYSHLQAQAGLSILSRYPITKSADLEYGTYACIRYKSIALLVANVHLPWDKASLRERAVVDIAESLSGIKADYTFLLGDFNCSENSSVSRFLTNEQSLLGADAYYFDLAEAYADMNGTRPPATLSFRKNPRWGTAEPRNTIEADQRFDRILLKDPYPEKLPELKSCTLFGTNISEETKLAASDHYGVMAEVEF